MPVTKTVMEAEGNADAAKKTNGEFPAAKKEEEETAFDGEFIKVEKESLDVKDGSHTASETASAEGNKSSVLDRSSRISSRELLEAQEKVRELEVEIERLAGVLKHSESENSQLKNEVSLTKEKLEESGEKYEDLELKHKRLQEQVIESEEKYSSQLSTLQEALQAQETKHKELIGVKESFDGLSLELDSSRKRMEELEQELKSSVGEAQKYEELHKQSGSHAESETKRALEIERLLKVAKLSAKEMEDQVASLQEELKGLSDKITENEKIQEALQSTTAELAAVQEELTLSNLKKVLESKEKGQISALEILVASTKEDLQAKVAELEEIKSKLQEEVRAKELVEALLKSREELVSVGQEELAKVVSDENFSKTDSLLSQSLSNNAELEQKLKSLEELHNESGAAAATASQKNIELEDIVRASNEAVEEAKSQLRELETRFIEAEQKNMELEQQLNLVELKSSDAERELIEYAESVEEEKKQLNGQIQEFQEKIAELESALTLSSSKNSELQEELKIAVGKCAEHEERASMNHQRGLELEDIIQLSHSRVEDSGKRREEKLEDASNSSNEKHAEAENLLEVLRNELSLMHEKLESTENDRKSAGMRESKVLEKLKSAEEQLEQQGGLLKEYTTRNSELEHIHESLMRDSEFKLQEAIAKFTNRDSEAKSLSEKLSVLEDQVKTYEEQVAEAAKICIIYGRIRRDFKETGFYGKRK
ncbi:hypothetical protein FNV43_RR12900 [Rhamnella rubrinervis]|uniref:Uncharacterized protein n=1 Tax=Rhamnella rubrinervis TaxID=2594499 RepID=A0A8K0H075_9ROSA|nr:hypothetical protein FNV43_RR12900 [Rhamnella rubrinervis]